MYSLERMYLWWSLCTLVFTCMPGKSYHRQIRSLLLHLCNVFQVLISSIVSWFLYVCGYSWGSTNKLTESKKKKKILWVNKFFLLAVYVVYRVTKAVDVVYESMVRQLNMPNCVQCGNDVTWHGAFYWASIVKVENGMNKQFIWIL